jgi:hypothetical protein
MKKFLMTLMFSTLLIASMVPTTVSAFGGCSESTVGQSCTCGKESRGDSYDLEGQKGICEDDRQCWVSHSSGSSTCNNHTLT